MKNRILFLFLFIVTNSFSQTINDYKAVVIPLKYEFQKTENQFRLQTITKLNLQKSGFEAFYSNEIGLREYPDRCSLLYLEVNNDNSLLVTKLFIVFKDCNGTIIYKSPAGKSREKEFQIANIEALKEAFVDVYALNYKFNGNTNYSSNSGFVVPHVPEVAAPVVTVSIPKNVLKTSENNSANLLFAQPTSYGYQLIDSEPKVIMKVYKTSNPNSYMVKKGEIQGTLFSKENQWFFEYYQNDKLISEKLEVKF